MTKRATPQHKLDERRFRLRLRFTLPVGEGMWPWTKVHAWLSARLGRDGYALHGDYWEGHGLSCYALHFDNHTVIPEFLTMFETLQHTVTRPKRFRAIFGHEDARTIRSALLAMQARLVERLNTPVKVVSWCLGRCELLNLSKASLGERRHCERINEIGNIAAVFSAALADRRNVIITIEDEHRGALETGYAMVRDLRPLPSPEDLATIRRFLQSLDEIKD